MVGRDNWQSSAAVQRWETWVQGAGCGAQGARRRGQGAGRRAQGAGRRAQGASWTHVETAAAQSTPSRQGACRPSSPASHVHAHIYVHVHVCVHVRVVDRVHLYHMYVCMHAYVRMHACARIHAPSPRREHSRYLLTSLTSLTYSLPLLTYLLPLLTYLPRREHSRRGRVPAASGASAVVCGCVVRSALGWHACAAAC